MVLPYARVWTDSTCTIVDVLQRRAQENPSARLFTFLRDGEAEGGHLGYGAADLRARALAVRLREAGKPGDRALILCPGDLSYLEAFLGCLYAGIVAVPAPPPNPLRMEQGVTRFRSIAEDAKPAIVLVTRELEAGVAAMLADFPELAGAAIVCVDDVPEDLSSSWVPPRMARDSLAFLQYTSGSTSTPRGVMVSHGNIIANERMIRDAFGHDERLVTVGWLPLFHDMGLIGNALQPLFVGGQLVFMTPMSFVRHPVRWLRAISRYRGTTSGGPSFAYDLCVSRLRPDHLASLDLQSWKVAYSGSERVRPETVREFCRAFAPAGFDPRAFYPCYGLAEATLFVAGVEHGAGAVTYTFDPRELAAGRVRPALDGGIHVGCGTAAEGEDVRIVNPDSRQECAPDEVGEIWVRGPNVTAGYWASDPGATTQHDAGLTGDAGGGFLRTGDLGFFHDGHLFVTGRIRELVIVAGQNHFPQDLERTAEAAHPAVRGHGVAALSVDDGREERLVVIVEIERGTSVADTRAATDAIRRQIADEHQVMASRLIMVRPGAIPRTSSGKIQRTRCVTMVREALFDAVFEWPTASQ